MINKLIIDNFKIHDHLDLPLGGLTMLTGMNGMGKSSVMQCLLLLRQSCDSQEILEGVNLKGALCDLGSARDIICQSSNAQSLNLIIEQEGTIYNFNFSVDVAINDTFLPILGQSPSKELLKECPLFTDRFQYASAFRFGPQKTYERDTNIVQRHHQISKNNGQCEYAVHFLEFYGRNECIPELSLKEESESTDNIDLTLKEQTVRWMRKISPKVNIYIEPVGGDFRLNYKFTRENNTITDEMSAINVGYGISYALPLIVAILSAKPGALIMIENPEAHIHPRAQAELMKLVARAVKAGIQIILETHSDHIINGALVAIAKDSSFADYVKAYYFDRDDNKHVSKAIPLEILNDGRIKNAPKGFFDQISIDLETIMGF